MTRNSKLYPKLVIGEICIGLKYPCRAQGSIPVSNEYHASLNVDFEIVLKKETGDIRLTYSIDGKNYEQGVKLKLVHWNMNYWRFSCPRCSKISKSIFLATDHYFGCLRCLRLFSVAMISEKVKSVPWLKQRMFHRTARQSSRKALYLLAKFLRHATLAVGAKKKRVSTRRAYLFARRYQMSMRPVTKELIAEIRARYPALGASGAETTTGAGASTVTVMG